MPVARMCASMSGSAVLSIPGAISAAINGCSGACFATSRTSRKPARNVSQSLSVAEKILPDAHRLPGICRNKIEPAAALRPQHDRAAGEAVRITSGEGRQKWPRGQRRRGEQELCVRQHPGERAPQKAITPPGRSAEMPDPKK